MNIWREGGGKGGAEGLALADTSSKEESFAVVLLGGAEGLFDDVCEGGFLEAGCEVFLLLVIEKEGGTFGVGPFCNVEDVGFEAAEGEVEGLGLDLAGF